MEKEILEIKDCDGAGYRPLIDYGAWRVAILRWEPESAPEKITVMERHTQTDEVFVLLAGQARLVLGGNGKKVSGIEICRMAGEKLYNVRRNAWHTVLMEPGTSILIVENQDTGDNNTEYCELSEKIREEIRGERK